jgi:ribose transport system ATP-binding protein
MFKSAAGAALEGGDPLDNLIEMHGITKTFPGVRALDDVHFDLRAGEVHALLGENGAGKSTLMKIISGIYTRDGGTYRMEGRPVEHLTPKKAQEMGIAIIHQELNMCQHLTVAENIFLGREESRFTKLRQRDMNRRAAEYLKQLSLSISPETPVSKLPVGGQQMVEIAKAVSTNCKVLIMDEPTSALTNREVDELNRIIHELKKRGVGIVYITHRLEELAPIADRVTILRDGRFVATRDFADISIDEIISLMVGREITEKFPHVQCPVGDVVLKVEHLNAGHMVRDVSFDLRKGEILGFAGLMGAGRTETMRAIFGADPVESGTVTLNGRAVAIHSPAGAIRAGIACVPEDRKKEGLCVDLSLRENVALANLDLLRGPLGRVLRRKEASLTQRAIDDLKIKASSQLMLARNLSGGNQQKVVVGKWLVRDAEVVLFDEPTRGIDVAAKVEIYHLMNQLKQKGIGVLFVSSEMPEILGMADRIVVMCDGRVTGEYEAAQATQDKIMQSATQFESRKGQAV